MTKTANKKREVLDTRYKDIPTTRTTFVLPETIDLNVEAYASLKSIDKAEVIARAMTQFLEAEGLQPDKYPTLAVAYPDEKKSKSA